MIYKPLTWAYDRGVLAERHRIRDFINSHKNNKPEPPTGKEAAGRKQYEFDLAVWNQVDAILNHLVYLHQEQIVYKSFLDIDEKL